MPVPQKIDQALAPGAVQQLARLTIRPLYDEQPTNNFTPFSGPKNTDLSCRLFLAARARLRPRPDLPKRLVVLRFSHVYPELTRSSPSRRRCRNIVVRTRRDAPLTKWSAFACNLLLSDEKEDRESGERAIYFCPVVANYLRLRPPPPPGL